MFENLTSRTAEMDQTQIDKMKSDAKIIAVKILKITAVVGIGYIAVQKIKANLAAAAETETTED